MSIRSRAARCVAVLAVAAIAPSIAGAQAAPAAALTPLKVGEMAPDFTVTVVTADGVAKKPFKLSEHKGETVVLAFFPKARTSGCTVQMESYRDKYADTFKGGKKVTLVGVSIDSDTARSRHVSRHRCPGIASGRSGVAPAWPVPPHLGHAAISARCRRSPPAPREWRGPTCNASAGSSTSSSDRILPALSPPR